ncbi:hypothetical protein GCM10009678_24740 [Actinomadura kijaniata]|uniref:Uncharacterized protein n=1 Tax=Actinomadura namibiensis TaxID=182080 RepID=A0A7W3QM95_ACTNM|nr:hypothetical protein [Actinomadura namibiensis]MBA8951763.1 hypothetical protein [Actinomadura namibiensis]
MATLVSPSSSRRAAAARRPATAHAHARRRWLGWGLAGGGLALVPWTFALAARLPSTAQVSNWSAAWVGLDVVLAAGLLGTGALVLRRDARYGLTAAATGALLVMDAWFDVLTSAPGSERAVAAALAAGVELPLAALCGILAARALSMEKSPV